jgi:hypothetical protein
MRQVACPVFVFQMYVVPQTIPSLKNAISNRSKPCYAENCVAKTLPVTLPASIAQKLICL